MLATDLTSNVLATDRTSSVVLISVDLLNDIHKTLSILFIVQKSFSLDNFLRVDFDSINMPSRIQNGSDLTQK